MRIVFNVARRSSFLAQAREVSTYTDRREMNRWLAPLFHAAKLSTTHTVNGKAKGASKAWTEAQAAYLKSGKQAAKKVIAKHAR